MNKFEKIVNSAALGISLVLAWLVAGLQAQLNDLKDSCQNREHETARCFKLVVTKYGGIYDLALEASKEWKLEHGVREASAKIANAWYRVVESNSADIAELKDSASHLHHEIEKRDANIKALFDSYNALNDMRTEENRKAAERAWGEFLKENERNLVIPCNAYVCVPERLYCDSSDDCRIVGNCPKCKVQFDIDMGFMFSTNQVNGGCR